MPKRTDIKTVLVIGSGPIVIGQACEFDYSGTQAVKALKEEGYRVVLVNSNPATIMTDPEFADRTYIEPITAEFVERVIERERPEVILPTIGGQTALNTAIELADRGVLAKYNVELIGAKVEAIKKAEDREAFKKAVEACGLDCAKSFIARTWQEARAAKSSLGYPLIIRPSRTLGGSGGAIVYTDEEFIDKVGWGFDCSPIHEILIEESLLGWKEMELEVMRDCNDNGVIICSIENIDPMGIHTGDSITVAPIQTLTDKEYQRLRDASLRLMSEIGVDTGGSNVQFAVCPRTGRQVVIELNPRVSRSSALASKATGFPIAKIAAKLAVGYTLDELPNDITRKTPACFEPSIDYVVVKIPRFAFEKFKGADESLGTQMKSVGEVMAIGRTFPEALQKACRSLEVDRTGLFGGQSGGLSAGMSVGLNSKADASDAQRKAMEEHLTKLLPDRLFAIARAIEMGISLGRIAELTAYDPWFLHELREIYDYENKVRNASYKSVSQMPSEVVLEGKMLGESDARLASLLGVTEKEVREHRWSSGIRPGFKQVDTCAAEFLSSTPYLYSTYDGGSDVERSEQKKIIILGGGPNRIGQGLEFDYCCVHASFALRDAGFETIMVNCNPETVSTDYDTSSRLYFEPLTLEDVLEIVQHEKPDGVIVQYGGQTPLKLSQALKACGVPIIGTSPDAIDLAEDRDKFRMFLDELGLLQAESATATTAEGALAVAHRLGYPLMVRPSFVLGGRAMQIIHSDEELDRYIRESVSVSFDRPVLLDRFLENAVEVDVDAVTDGTEVLIGGVVEHIELAGIHSGDSSFILPSKNLSSEVLSEIEKSTKLLALKCGVIGLMNVQFAVCDHKVYVLEVNPRASRSVPFISKVMGIAWAKVAARVMAGESLASLGASGVYGDILQYRDYQSAVQGINYVAVKESVFPFIKFRGVDTILGPEMKSTGEVMGIDSTVGGAFARAQLGSGTALPTEGVVIMSLKAADKEPGLAVARDLVELGFRLVATSGTADFLAGHGLAVEYVNKVREGSPHIVEMIRSGKVGMVINTPEGYGPRMDSTPIRSSATEMRLPLFTTIAASSAAVNGIAEIRKGMGVSVCSLQEYLGLEK